MPQFFELRNSPYGVRTIGEQREIQRKGAFVLAEGVENKRAIALETGSEGKENSYSVSNIIEF